MKDEKKPELELSPEEMKRRIAEAEQFQVKKCTEEIQAVLQQHGCELRMVQVFVNGIAQPMQIQIAKSQTQ